MSCAHPAEVEALLFQFFYVRFLYTINSFSNSENDDFDVLSCSHSAESEV